MAKKKYNTKYIPRYNPDGSLIRKTKPGDKKPSKPGTLKADLPKPKTVNPTMDAIGKGIVPKGAKKAKSDKPAVSRYEVAKNKNKDLDKWIKIRNNAKKGSAEYNMAQNKINKAYGSSTRRDAAAGTGEKAKSIKAAPIKTTTPAKGLAMKPTAKKPAVKKPVKPSTGPGSGMGGVQAAKDMVKGLLPKKKAAAKKPAKKKTIKPARNTGSGSGMGSAQAERNALKSLGITTGPSELKFDAPVSKRAKRKAKRAAIKDVKKRFK